MMKTAEWIWQGHVIPHTLLLQCPSRPAVTKPLRLSFATKAKLEKGHYHENMDGAMFERWLDTRFVLVHAFEEKYSKDMKMVLVVDNASYHHEPNQEYFPNGKTPSNAPKRLCNDVLHKAGSRSIKVMRDGEELNFDHQGRRESGQEGNSWYSTRQFFSSRSFWGRAPPRHEGILDRPLPRSA